MTPGQMAELAARLRIVKHTDEWQNIFHAAADLIESMAQHAEPVATVYYPRTGGNVGLSWRAIPEAGAMPQDGAKLYLAPQSQRVPLSEEQVFADDGIMAANALIGISLYEIMEIVRATESAHGIRSEK